VHVARHLIPTIQRSQVQDSKPYTPSCLKEEVLISPLDIVSLAAEVPPKNANGRAVGNLTSVAASKFRAHETSRAQLTEAGSTMFVEFKNHPVKATVPEKTLERGLLPASPSLQSNCGCPLSTRQDRIEICDHDSSVELDQVLKNQLTPAISARLD
jgi:hypothetical protein